METFRKINDEIIEITSTKTEEVVVSKDLSQLESDLKQAQDSLVYVMQRHADEIAPIQTTISIMQKRLDDAKALGLITSKPVEVIKEVVEKPLIDEGMIK